MHPQSASMRAEGEQINKSKCKTCKFYHRSKSLGGKSECRRNLPVLKITYHRKPNRWDEHVMKMPSNKKLIYDTQTGRARIVEQISPKLDASRKLQMRKSKKQRPARRTV